MQSPTLDTGKFLRKILLHPGQFVFPRRIYRDFHGLDRGSIGEDERTSRRSWQPSSNNATTKGVL